MINLSNLKPPKGAKKGTKRIGRGQGSGWGGTAGKGNKGQRARSGGSKGAGFEGGQMPLQRRLPKRGFVNPDHIVYRIVKVGDLARFSAGAVVDQKAMIEAGLVRSEKELVKILADGEIGVSLTVKAHKWSRAAEQKIADAGGSLQKL